MLDKLRIGLDTSLLNKGYPLPFVDEKARPGLEIEECQTLMRILNWTHEFIIYENNVGYVANSSASAGSDFGMLGDLSSGKLDMICGRLRMTESRRKAYDFSYPVAFTVKQVYVVKNVFGVSSQAHNFILKPFSITVWLLLLVAIVLMIQLFSSFRIIYGKRPISESLTSGAWHIIKVITHMEGFTPPSLTIERCATNIWILLWVHVFCDSYLSEMTGFLTVPDKIVLPFQNFEGFAHNLETGQYVMLNSQLGRFPECPTISDEDCFHMFDQTFNKYPPVIGNFSRIINSTQHLVSVMWYSDDRVPFAVSRWMELGSKTDLLALRDDYVQIDPAAFAFRKNFSFMRDVDNAVIKMLPAFERISRRYSPPYPQYPLTPPVHQVQISMDRLIAAFGLWAGGMVLGIIVFLLERARSSVKGIFIDLDSVC